jgi:hypothetical protein
MNLLVTLVQIGPTGAGLAFALLGYWLLKAESKKDKVRPPLIDAIRYFISLSVITFTLGLIANIATLVLSSRTETLINPDVTTVRLNMWDANYDKKSISFSLLAETLDVSHYVPRADKQKYRLIVAVRPRSGEGNDAGSYLQAFGDYAFDSLAPQQPALSQAVIKMFEKGCTDFVLFRVNASRLKELPVTSPFEPSKYGTDIKVLNSGFDGAKCP